MRTLHRGYLHGENKLWDHIQHHHSKINCSNQEYTLTLIFQGITHTQKFYYYLYVTRNSCATED